MTRIEASVKVADGNEFCANSRQIAHSLIVSCQLLSLCFGGKVSRSCFPAISRVTSSVLRPFLSWLASIRCLSSSAVSGNAISQSRDFPFVSRTTHTLSHFDIHSHLDKPYSSCLCCTQMAARRRCTWTRSPRASRSSAMASTWTLWTR